MALADVGGVAVVHTAILWGKHDMQSTYHTYYSKKEVRMTCE